MRKFQIRLLALLLICALASGLTACAAADVPEPTEEKTVIQVPEPVTHEKCTELGTPLADVRVRRALAHAIDVDTVVGALYYGTGESVANHTYDPEKAKELLAEAGWPSDYVLDVVFCQEDPQMEDLLNVIVQYWDAVGVKAEVRKIEEDAAKQLWTAPADPEGDSAVIWDLAICAVSDLTQQHFLDRFASESARNSHTPKTEGLDEAIEQGDMEGVRQILEAQVSYIPLFCQDGFVCISDRVNPAGMEAGNDRYAYNKEILNWTTDREDNTLYTGSVPEGTGLCPLTDPGQLYQELVFDRLIAADQNLNPAAGQIAESYTLHGNTATFTLREELSWHDGEPLTAEDVEFTFELYLQCPDTDPVLRNVLEKLEGAEDFVNGDARDCVGITAEENVVTFRFAEEAEDALEVFSQWPILPKHKLENVMPAKLLTHKFWKNPVGSGPFRVEELEPGKTCLLERWDGYWQGGDGNIGFVRMNAAGEGLSVLAARKLLDYGWGLSSDDASYIAQLEHMEVIPVEDNCTVCFFINQFPHESYFASEEATEPTE